MHESKTRRSLRNKLANDDCMMSCKILSTVYGRDTRPAQWLNICIACMWLLAAGGEYTGWFVVALPATVSAVLSQTALLFGLVLGFSLCNFITVGRIHQITKAFGFALGGLANMIITNSYVSAYPPVDMMLLVSLILSILLFGAVFFILQCEGINGVCGRAP